MATSIFKYIQKNDVTGVRKVLTAFETAVVCKDSQGRTPLHVACHMGAVDCCRELLRFKAQCDATDNLGNLPIHLACEQGPLELVSELLSGHGRKATAKKKNYKGQTPLHVAAASGNPEVVAALLDAGARSDKDTAGHLPQDLIPIAAPGYQQVLDLLARSAELSSPAPNAAGPHLSRKSISGVHAPPAHTPPTTPAPAPTANSHSTPATTPLQESDGTAVVSSIARSSPVPPLALNSSPGIPSGNSRIGSGKPSGTGATAAGGTAPASKAAGAGAITGGGSARGAKTPGVSAIPSSIRQSGQLSSRALNGPSSARSAPQASPVPPALVQQLQAELQALQARMEVFQEAGEASATARREWEEQLLQAQATIHTQEERIEDMEARLALVEKRNTDLVARLERMDEQQAQQTQALKEQAAAQPWAPAVRAVAEQVQHIQAAQGSLQESVKVTQQQLEQAVRGMIGAVLDNHTASASHAEPLPRTLSLSDLDGLKSRVSRIEALGISDQLEVLALRAQQLSTNLSSLTSAHQETSEKLAAVLRWQADHTSTSRLSDVGGEAGGAGAGLRREGSVGMPSVATNMVRVEVRLGELEAQRAQEAAALEEHKAAQDALKQALTALQEQVVQMQSVNPSTPAPPGTPAPLTPSTSTKRNALASAAASAATQSLEEMHATIGSLHKDVSGLKDSVEELRTHLNVVTGTLRREWEAAVAEAGRRAAESAAEMSERESRIKAMKEAMVSDGHVQATMADLEKRMKTALETVDTRLELLKHKVEVVQEQQETLRSGQA